VCDQKSHTLFLFNNSPYAILVFVANGDRHYSPARIAGSAVKKHSVAEGDEQLPA
jgi:hypothetical protein